MARDGPLASRGGAPRGGAPRGAPGGGTAGWRRAGACGGAPAVGGLLVKAGIGGAGVPGPARAPRLVTRRPPGHPRILLAARRLVAVPTRRTHGASVAFLAADIVRTGI